VIVSLNNTTVYFQIKVFQKINYYNTYDDIDFPNTYDVTTTINVGDLPPFFGSKGLEDSFSRLG